MAIQLSEHFTAKKLFKLVFPTIVMMVFTSIYGVVDGFFVSNFVGKIPFAAINLILPVLMIFGAVGFMIGTGGSALVSKTMGEGDRQKANEYFSLLTYFLILFGIAVTIVGYFTVRPISYALGARGETLEYCVQYGKILCLALIPFMLQNMFQSFFATAEKPKLGLAIVLAAGVTNMVLDALFMAVLHWGVVGAAVATLISQVVGGVAPLVYFACKNKSLLRLGKTRFHIKALLLSCLNGLSELLTNVSMSIVSMLYNWQLLRLAGENGVAAYGFIMYVSYIFAAIYIGYSMGIAPVVGYHFGAENRQELKNLFKKSMVFVAVSGVVLAAAAIALSVPLAKLFVGYDEELFLLTKRGFRIYAISFLLFGFSIFGSAFFTALNNGVVSAVISFMRTLVFQSAAIVIMPFIWGLDGVWFSIIVAEVLAFAVSVVFYVAMKKRYGYA